MLSATSGNIEHYEGYNLIIGIGLSLHFRWPAYNPHRATVQYNLGRLQSPNPFERQHLKSVPGISNIQIIENRMTRPKRLAFFWNTLERPILAFACLFNDKMIVETCRIY